MADCLIWPTHNFSSLFCVLPKLPSIVAKKWPRIVEKLWSNGKPSNELWSFFLWLITIVLITSFCFIVHEGLLCGKLTVTGHPWKGCTGTYIIDEKKASKSPEKPIYKREGLDRYIYFNPSSIGWRLGRAVHLSGEDEGSYYFGSKLQYIIHTYGHKRTADVLRYVLPPIKNWWPFCSEQL